MKLKIKLDKGATMPTRAHAVDAGLDLYVKENVFILPKMKELVSTGVHVEIPEGYFGQVSLRSGIASKSPLILANGVGIIDTGYTGEIKLCLHNLDERLDIELNAGEKIAQLVIIPCALPELEPVDELDESERGPKGFGSTGK